MLIKAIKPHKNGKNIYSVGDEYEAPEPHAKEKIKAGICIAVEVKAVDAAPENKSKKKAGLAVEYVAPTPRKKTVSNNS